MLPSILRRSTPCSPAAGNLRGANNWSSVAILRPLMRATAPPKRSPASRNSDLTSGSADVCDGVSVSSIKVPSTSRNKHQSSDGGGGDWFMRQKHNVGDVRCQCFARFYLQCKFYTK